MFGYLKNKQQLFHYSYIMMSCILLFIIICNIFFTNGIQRIDDVTLFNPIYNWVNTGKLVYPIHEFPNSVSVHPPMHYFIIAVLMKLGFSIRFAQSFLLLIFVFGILVWGLLSKVTNYLKLGIIMSLVGIFLNRDLPIRPDLTISVGILLGYLILYEAVLANKKTHTIVFLFIGTIIVSFVSLLHYYAWGAIGGIVVALFYIYKSNKDFKILLYGLIPFSLIYFFYFYFVFFPDINNIKLAFQNNDQGSFNIFVSIERHFELYEELGIKGRIAYFIYFLLSKYTFIPLWVYTLLISFLNKRTQPLFFMTLPYSVALFLFAQHKNTEYIHIEFIFFFSAILILIEFLINRFCKNIFHTMFSFSIIILSFIVFIQFFHTTDFAINPIQQAELSRWCGKKINNQNKTIISTNNSCWYISGAKDYILPGRQQIDKFMANDSYLERKKSFVYLESSDISSSDQATFTEWRLKDSLMLNGFFCTKNGIELPYLIYSKEVFNKGYYYAGNNQLYEYKKENSNTSYIFISLLTSMNNNVDCSLKTSFLFLKEFKYSTQKSNIELYTGILKGKKLVWGVVNRELYNELIKKKEINVIDTFYVTVTKLEIPKRKELENLIFEKPIIKVANSIPADL